MKKFYAFFSIIVIALFLKPQTLQAQGRLTDSVALVTFYAATGGPTWTNSSNWLSATQPIDTWYGVHLSADGRVDSLSLPNNNLTGSVFPTITNDDTMLVKLDVSHNSLSGGLPYFSSKGLLILDISYNQLSGAINYYATPNLVVLRMNNNQLNGSIASLNYYANMTVLDASNNAFTSEMPYFQSVNFDTINLSYNQLSGAINYYPVQKLRYMNVSHNALTGNGNAIPFTSKAEVIDYSYNQLTGSLPYFTSTTLKWLNLSHNQFSGTMNYSKVPNLTYINVSYNQLTGPADPITDVSSYTGIKYIHMSHNLFTTGQYGLPYFNSNTLYDSIDLSYNNLTGPIGYYTFPSCVYYNLSYNQLSGALPNFTGYAANVALNISHNKFTFNELEPGFNNLPAVTTYAPQDTLVWLSYAVPKLTTAYAGGTLANNTYSYYRLGNVLDGSATGDSTYSPTATGTYFAEVTNSVVTNLTLFSDSVVVSTLPVTFGSFTGELINYSKNITARLNWATYTEFNNNHFDIERSNDAALWEKQGTVNSKAPGGRSNATIQYTFDDITVPSTIPAVYYRLKQVDLDGKAQYSKVIKLNINNSNALSIKVLPNIVSGRFNITLNAAANRQVSLRIVSSNGTIVYTKANVMLQPGDNTVTVNNFGKYAGGLYHIEVMSNDTHEKIGTYKILKN